MKIAKRLIWVVSVLVVGGLTFTSPAMAGCGKRSKATSASSTDQQSSSQTGMQGMQMGDGMSMCGNMKKDKQNMAGMEGNEKSSAGGKVIQSQRAKDLSITLSNASGKFGTGENAFCAEFRNVHTGESVDPGKVYITFTMAGMEGMPAAAKVSQSGVGRYCGHVNLGMAGTWSSVLKYDGPAGKGKMTFNVQVK